MFLTFEHKNIHQTVHCTAPFIKLVTLVFKIYSFLFRFAEYVEIDGNDNPQVVVDNEQRREET